ncbi:MAG: hypothetical protein V9H25_06535 [Candidatus Competibacter sp.]
MDILEEIDKAYSDEDDKEIDELLKNGGILTRDIQRRKREQEEEKRRQKIFEQEFLNYTKEELGL